MSIKPILAALIFVFLVGPGWTAPNQATQDAASADYLLNNLCKEELVPTPEARKFIAAKRKQRGYRIMLDTEAKGWNEEDPSFNPVEACKEILVQYYGKKGENTRTYGFVFAKAKKAYKNSENDIEDFEPEVRDDICADQPSLKGCN